MLCGGEKVLAGGAGVWKVWPVVPVVGGWLAVPVFACARHCHQACAAQRVPWMIR